MKYKSLPKQWQRIALQMEIKSYQESVNQLAKHEYVEPWIITKDSQEVQDAINDDNEYVIIKNKHTNQSKLEIL